MNAAFFKNLPVHLFEYIGLARVSLRIAVCWFSHRDLFDILIKKLREGVSVELLFEYDSQNIREGGLDFQRFIDHGGRLFTRREAGLMHHKFVLIDDDLLLTGSFNWTYNNNAENLVLSTEPALITAFLAEFEREKAESRQIFQVRREEIRVFSAYPLFENTCFQLTGLRRAVSRGATAWLVRLEKCPWPTARIFRENRLPFDPLRLLGPFWAASAVWDETRFKGDFSSRAARISPALSRELCRWAVRIRIGDLIFATLGRQQMIALGVVQSLPRQNESDGGSSCRDVQWLRRHENNEPYFLPEKLPAAGLAKFRGSALRVIQDVLE